jgi:glycosyltransferase involved in cell wall biosynthesis
MKIFVAIPCLNEERFIGDIVQRARKYVDKVIVIDDGSADNTSVVARDAGAEVIKHQVSLGAGAATSSGFKAAKAQGADILVTIDGDGQHNPDEIPRLIQPIIEGKADFVIGSRFMGVSSNMQRYRKFGIDVITGLFNMGAKTGITDSQSGFRAHSRKLLETVEINENGFAFSIEVLAKARKKGLAMVAVPISCIYHNEGSSMNPLLHGLKVVWGVIQFRIKSSFNRL